MTKIRYKIGSAIALISLAIATIVGIISFWSSKNIISSEAESKLKYIVRSYGLDFEQDLAKINHLSSSIEALILGTIDDKMIKSKNFPIESYKQKILPIVNKILQTFSPMTCWIIFDPGLAMGKHTISFEDIDNDGVYVREVEYSINDYDLGDTSMKWWVDAIKYGEVWTKPYLWENWGIELISYSRKVEVDNKIIACVGSDFDFHTMRKELGQVEVYNTGYMALMDDNQNFIIHPRFGGKNLSEVLDSATYQQIVHLFGTQKEGMFYYKLGDVDKIMAFYNLTNGWSLSVVVEVDDIYSNSYRIFKSIVIVIVIGIVLSVIIAYILSSSLTRPIYQLVDQLRLGVGGNLDVRAKVYNLEEINELARYFNRFMETIQTMIEQLKKSEHKLNEAKLKAEESDKLKSAFLANISHEVRTPLNAILGFSQILAQDNTDFEMKQKYLQYIGESSERLTSIVDDIMIFSQIEQGLITMKVKQIDLNSFLNNVYNDFYNRFAHNNLGVKFSLVKTNDNPPNVLTDIVSLKRVLYILLSNAWKFTEAGEISFGYNVNEEQKLLFFVSDTGFGIPDEEQDNVFLKFYKHHPSTEKFFDGTGLGLAIARDLVHLMGGNIWIESKLKVGTTIYFNIKTQN